MRKLCSQWQLVAAPCAPKTVPSPSCNRRGFLFRQADDPSEYVIKPPAAALYRGWNLLQAGDLKTAERELSGGSRWCLDCVGRDIARIP